MSGYNWLRIYAPCLYFDAWLGIFPNIHTIIVNPEKTRQIYSHYWQYNQFYNFQKHNYFQSIITLTKVSMLWYLWSFGHYICIHEHLDSDGI